jgi:hypothetical protein
MARTGYPAAQHTRPLPIADLDHALATGCAVLGLLGLLCAALGAAVPAVALGLLGLGVGLWAQMMSRTRTERFVDIAALLVCFLAFAVGASQGGLPSL